MHFVIPLMCLDIAEAPSKLSSQFAQFNSPSFVSGESVISSALTFCNWINLRKSSATSMLPCIDGDIDISDGHCHFALFRMSHQP